MIDDARKWGKSGVCSLGAAGPLLTHPHSEGRDRVRFSYFNFCHIAARMELPDHQWVSHCVELAITSGNKADQREKISELMAVIGRSDR